MTITERINEIKSLKQDQCWYITKQPLSFKELCYAAKIVEEYQEGKSSLNFADFFNNEKALEFGISPNHRMTNNCYYIGLLEKNGSEYKDSILTDVYHEIKKRCNSNFENIDSYKDILVDQIEKVFVTNEVDRAKDGLRSNISINPAFFLAKVLINLGDTTGDYSISLSEFYRYVGTSLNYNYYLSTIELIIESRKNIKLNNDLEYIDDFFTNLNKIDNGNFSNNRLHLLLSNLPYFNITTSKISFDTKYIQEIKYKLYVYECNYNDDLFTLKYLNSVKRKDNNFTSNIKIKNKNIIFYGAPGTGKTHNAINRALSIIKGNDLVNLTRDQIKTEFDDFIESGQIQFVTFHQSYSYEEFIEGIKPIVNDQGDVEYQIVDGIFKKLCLEAENDSMLKIGDQFQNSRNSIFTISKYNSQIIEITRDEGSIITFPTDLISGLLKLLNENIIDISNIQSREKDGVPLQELLDIKFDKYIFGYDSIIKTLIEFIQTKDRSIKKNYVLIIDEINRGNISKIFGELITLIEDSKRIGNPESLRAKLTYSGVNSDEMFGVPNNLYIIGTMNTADRSITNIDTALRRRFVFEEFPPIYNLPEIGKVTHANKEINLQDVLRILNERIEYLLDRDHLIGHSYFIGVNDWDTLCSKFRNNIIPLLQEYFYNDWEKIALVLGDNDSWQKNDDEKFILKKKYSSETLFGKNNNLEEEFDENQYYINQNLVDKKYDELSEQFFIKGFQSEE